MTKNSTKKIPRLRFKGFSGEWEEKKLGDISEVFDGVHQTPEYQNKGVPFISVENLKNLLTNKYISEKAFEKDFKNNRLHKGDILMSRIGSIGEDNIVKNDEPMAFYVSLASIRSDVKFINPVFLMYLIKSSNFKNELWRRTLHVAFPKKINKNEISKIYVTIPKINEEQQKIGSFFAKLDQLIDLQRQKVEQFKKIKRGYLQKMFPQKGESIPRLRFNGFSGEWEEKKLGDIIEPINSKKVDKPEKYNLLKVQLHFKGAVKSKDHPRVTSNGRPYYLRNPGELIIGRQNFHHGGIAITNNSIYNCVASNAIQSFSFKNNNKYFVYNCISRKDWLKRTTIYINGTGQKEYSLRTLNKLKVMVPNISEENYIGSFLLKLDLKFNYEELKLKKLIKLKKSYLQKMFC